MNEVIHTATDGRNGLFAPLLSRLRFAAIRRQFVAICKLVTPVSTAFAVMCGGLRWFAMVCGGLSFSHARQRVSHTH